MDCLNNIDNNNNNNNNNKSNNGNKNGIKQFMVNGTLEIVLKRLDQAKKIVQ